MNSCKIYAASAKDREITTVKKIGTLHEPHPIQEALPRLEPFSAATAPRHGACHLHVARKKPQPDRRGDKEALDGNFCRCTGYVKIIDAVKLAAEKVKEND